MNRRKRDMRWCPFTAALLAVMIGGFPAIAQAPPCLDCNDVGGKPLKGAIFTTVVDGTRVNANQYEAKEDV